MRRDLLNNNEYLRNITVVTRMAQKLMLGCMDTYNPDTDDWSV